MIMCMSSHDYNVLESLCLYPILTTCNRDNLCLMCCSFNALALGSDDISVGEESLPASGELEGEGEEEAWLDALETGGVDDTGYLPQKKNPKLLTTRQVMVLFGQLLCCHGRLFPESTHGF